MTESRMDPNLTAYNRGADAGNSVESTWLAHLTDSEIKRRIEDNFDRLANAARVFPGTDVKGAQSLAEALQIGGADFDVIKRPVMAVISEDEAVPMPGAFATLRADTMTPLGKRVVGEGYQVVQTVSAFAAADVLIRDGAFHPCSVQIADARIRLNGFIGADAIHTLQGGADLIAHFASFGTAHDGTANIEASLSTLRLACFNGMTTRDLVASVKIRHTRNAEERIAEAASAIFKLRESAVTETLLLQRLAREPMSGTDFRVFAHELLDSVRGTLHGSDTERKKDKRDAEVAELLDLFNHGQGNHGISAYDGFNSVTEWLDHKLERGGISSAQRRLRAFESNDSGHGNRIKARALRLLTR